MKHIVIFFSMLVWIWGSIAAQTHPGVDVQVSRFEKEGESVVLDYIISTDQNHFSSCESVLLTPFIKEGDSILYFDPVIVNGRLRRNSFKRRLALHPESSGSLQSAKIVTVGEPGSQSLSFSKEFPYQEWMDGAALYATQIVWECGDDFSERTSRLATLVVPEPEPAVVPEPEPEPEIKILHKEGTAFIDFPIGRSTINLDFGSNRHELSRVGELIREINEDPNAKITGLEITGFASPDGPYAVNDRLSRERAQALSRQINLYYKLNLSPGQIQISSVAEDWEGLTQMVEESNLSHRNEILDIIRTIPSLDERERVLTRLDGGSVWRTLKADFLPKLRRTEYRILYQVKK